MADMHSSNRSSSETAASPAYESATGAQNLPADEIPVPETHTDHIESLRQPLDDTLHTYNSVLHSDIGVNTLLTRLKQSIASTRDFAAFLKKRSSLEEEHAQAIKKLCRSASESVRRPDSRQGSYSRNYEDITSIHDRMADNGIQFALSLHQMHEDLQELAADKERGRKHWKQSGLSAEKRVQDSESAMEKAKTKYSSLAEDYDRARTGDRQSGRFGLKGPKSAAQVEEDLHRKMQAADSDYSSKVQSARSMRQELLTTLRPQAIQAVEQLITECDSGLTLQMQKFATFNEKLLLSNGLCVSPLNDQNDPHGSQSRSLRDVVYHINNEQDLRTFVTSFSSKIGPRHMEPKYQPHPTSQTSQPLPQPAQTNVLSRQPQASIQSPQSFAFSQASPSHNSPSQQGPYPNPPPASFSSSTMVPTANYQNSPQQQENPSVITSSLPYVNSQQPLYLQPPSNEQETISHPNRPVFGKSLEDLFIRDGSAVPMVVYQCLQAVDTFGLEVEGIYRLSGTASHVAKLRATFDSPSEPPDFRVPENFFHDIHSCTGLLKQFFKSLPDPLLTNENYQAFIEAAHIDDDTTRRDSLHALVNSLPDPNYATLRALTLHLYRVQDHSANNRMNSGNLAIVFGPTLMVGDSIPAIQDSGWQVRIVDTILQNALSIFDED